METSDQGAVFRSETGSKDAGVTAVVDLLDEPTDDSSEEQRVVADVPPVIVSRESQYDIDQ